MVNNKAYKIFAEKNPDSPIFKDDNGDIFICYDRISLGRGEKGYGVDIKFWYQGKLVYTSFEERNLINFNDNTETHIPNLKGIMEIKIL